MKYTKVALVGNPNSGKSSLFNKLTGLHQKTGNYPGVTVDKKIGYFKGGETHFQVVDLPGIYSLYPSSKDEEIVYELLTNPSYEDYPEKVIFLADASNLRRSFLLFQQLQDLRLPVLFCLNMLDEAQRKGLTIDTKKLCKVISTDLVLLNARKGIGIEALKKEIENISKPKSDLKYFKLEPQYEKLIKEAEVSLSIKNPYLAWTCLTGKSNRFTSEKLFEILTKYKIIPKRLQVKETLDRYRIIDETLKGIVTKKEGAYLSLSEKMDTYLTHPLWGYLIFLSVLFFIFQGVYFWSEAPKEMIESVFCLLKFSIEKYLPLGPLRELLTKGIIPGLSSIFSFIPQIFTLLFFLLLIEESGYVSRIVFLMDRLMRPFGLGGKSLVPLISGAACAIPAVMSARNIENPRDRLITILVVPFMTCAARLPVYILIIGLVIPDKNWGIFSLHGLVLVGMYLFGVLLALSAAMVLNKTLKKPYKSYLILDIPSYKWPSLMNVFISLWFRIKSFVFGTGKIILAVSVIIWVLGSFGPCEDSISKENSFIESKDSVENSYLGIIGKTIEPAVLPLGYDWKISIGLIASLIAREVFVGTMASVYALQENQEEGSLKNRMRQEIRPQDGKPLYGLATGMSLLVFYALAMQCLSTLAVVRQETKSWKWPLLQLIFMTGFAYIFSFIIYQILN